MEDIWKGNTFFCKSQYIKPLLKEILDELKAEDYLKNSSKENFIKRTAYYMCEINMIHPFREGNGRVIDVIPENLIGLSSG